MCIQTPLDRAWDFCKANLTQKHCKGDRVMTSYKLHFHLSCHVIKFKIKSKLKGVNRFPTFFLDSFAESGK